ncbi:MAG: amidohydrolase family protein [Rubrivivax sp.]|nr:amidohydrolase family protein [Rubrivivax sp.]
MRLSDAPLPPRVWMAGARVPAALLGQASVAAAVRCALLLDGGRIAAVEETVPPGDVPVVDLEGGTVFSAFVDPHTHLDKGDLLAAGLKPERNLFRAIDAVRDDYARWTADELRIRMGFALRTAQAHGTRALLGYFDWAATGPRGHPLALDTMLDLRDAWRGRVEIVPASLATIDVLADDAAAERLGRTMADARGVLGVFVYPSPHVAALIPRAFDLAARFDLPLDFHVDEHLAPPVANLPVVARLARERGWGARTVCGHACLLSAMDEAARDATLDEAAAAGLALVALPYTNLHLQDGTPEPPWATPRRRGLLPVHEAAARGIAVALGSDNHRDPFFPAGDLDPLQTLALAACAVQLDDPVERWAATITRTPAERLGLAWDGVLRPGAPADLVIHPGRRSAEVMARPTRGRVVLRVGQPLPPEAAEPPDFRELDALRR